MKRREFLRLSVGAAGLAALSPILGCDPDESNPPVNRTDVQPLRIPQKSQGGSLTASYGSTQVWPGAATNALLLNSIYLGPTFEVTKGSTFSTLFSNQLGEPSNIHWHGLTTPANMDGHPADAIASGSLQYTFPIVNRAGTYWYHAHPDMQTGKQTYSGFAGFFIVKDPAETFQLPSGNEDVPLLLQEKKTINGSNELSYDPKTDDLISGYLGNEVFVNGTPNAYLEVTRRAYKFRILNGSNARVYRIAFSDDRGFRIAATDGGYLDSAYLVNEAMLSPGERIEIIVWFNKDDAGDTLKLISKEFAVGGHGHSSQGQKLDIMEFRVKTSEAIPDIIPGNLATLEQLNPAEAARVRTFRLTMDHGRTKNIHMIDDKIFEMHRADYQVPFGDLEIWQIENAGAGLHSMHIHGTHFQVLSRSTGTLTPVDYGWKDTVLVNDNETVRIILRFNDYKGRYLFHCHMLEHEDDGMMVNVDVV